jgi:hypothetical protein
MHPGVVCEYLALCPHYNINVGIEGCIYVLLESDRMGGVICARPEVRSPSHALTAFSQIQRFGSRICETLGHQRYIYKPTTSLREVYPHNTRWCPVFFVFSVLLNEATYPLVLRVRIARPRSHETTRRRMPAQRLLIANHTLCSRRYSKPGALHKFRVSQE